MSEQPDQPQQEPDVRLDDQAELELRDRVTELEHWRDTTEQALALILLGLIAMACAGAILAFLNWRQHS